jgi:hypothetical protein
MLLIGVLLSIGMWIAVAGVTGRAVGRVLAYRNAQVPTRCLPTGN